MNIKLNEKEFIITLSKIIAEEIDELKATTANRARNQAIVGAYDTHPNQVFNTHPQNDKMFHRKIRQINKFNTYAIEMLQQLIKTKCQLMVHDTNDHILFYNGVITNIKQKDDNNFIANLVVNNEFNEDDTNRNMEVLMTFENNRVDFHVEGYGDTDMRFNNKKARSIFANLADKNGKSEYYKPI